MANKAFGGPDTRVENALGALGLEFEVSDDGGYSLEFDLSGGRSQRVFIQSGTVQIANLELRKIYSCGYMGSAPLSAATDKMLLDANWSAPFGSWATFSDQQETFLVFNVRIPADLAGVALREILSIVAELADDAEREFMGYDAT